MKRVQINHYYYTGGVLALLLHFTKKPEDAILGKKKAYELVNTLTVTRQEKIVDCELSKLITLGRNAYETRSNKKQKRFET